MEWIGKYYSVMFLISGEIGERSTKLVDILAITLCTTVRGTADFEEIKAFGRGYRLTGLGNTMNGGSLVCEHWAGSLSTETIQ